MFQELVMPSISRLAPTIARVLLGLPFLVFGLNFFFHFLPQPPLDPEAGGFLGALVAGKLLSIIKVVEVAAGVALLANFFVPLALALLAPALVGIVAFHAVFDPAGLAIPLVLTALEVYLAWAYRGAFAPMLQARTAPTAGGSVVAP
jgi:uncharacterized membrane protein YphA (DoxX/SURF4 family)